MSWRKIFKCSKKIFQGVTTRHDYIVKCTCVTLGVTHFVNSSLLIRDRRHDMARTIRQTKMARDFVPLK